MNRKEDMLILDLLLHDRELTREHLRVAELKVSDLMEQEEHHSKALMQQEDKCGIFAERLDIIESCIKKINSKS